MMKFVFLFAVVICTVFSLNVDFDVAVEKGKPFTGTLKPVGLYGDVTVHVEGTIDKTLILCFQAETNLPVMSRYSSACTEKVELVPTGTITTSTTTGVTTTGSTTAAVTTTTSTTTDVTTTGSTTAAVTTTTSTTTGVTTTGSTTAGWTTTTGWTTTGGAGYYKRNVIAGGSAARFKTNVYTVTLRNVNYNVGVYFKTEPGKDATDKQTFKLKVTGVECPADKTGKDCDEPLATWTSGTEGTYNKGEDYYFKLTQAARANTVTITTTVDFTISARFAGAPFDGKSDYSGSGKSLTIPSPQLGDWYLLLTPAASGEAKLTSEAKTCPAGFAGTACKVAVSNLNGTNYNKTAELKVDDVVMFTVEGDLNSLLISARNTKVEETKQPLIFASYNRSPQFTGKAVDANTVDLAGCNVAVCKNLNQINLQRKTSIKAEKGTWFVAVQAQAAGSVLVWSNSICPNNCSEHGTCSTSGDSYGVCSCEPSRNSDLVCSGSDFLVEYIILIVIASLVAISAIIGLVAWAYMKSKHKGYEPV